MNALSTASHVRYAPLLTKRTARRLSVLVAALVILAAADVLFTKP
jgi:hypothetical protein